MDDNRGGISEGWKRRKREGKRGRVEGGREGRREDGRKGNMQRDACMYMYIKVSEKMSGKKEKVKEPSIILQSMTGPGHTS